MARTRSWWGWGYEDARIDPAAILPLVRETLGFGGERIDDPVDPQAIALRAPRLETPWSHDHLDRLHHALGKSYLDTVRAFRGRVADAPDAVCHAQTEEDVAACLAWAAEHGAKVVPYGGGTSVVGGVEPRGIDAPVISLDLAGLDRVLEVDPVSRSARIQSGLPGPEVERQLAGHGMTLRFFPQSFELSTVGGWLATRAGGHFATLWTHVDDLVESIRAVTPTGVWESRRLPGSGAGPSPDRMLLGSEGTLAVITEAWLRVQPKPEHRASRAVRFARFADGVEAVRALSQSGLHPANCRLVDALEAQQTNAGDGTSSVLVLGFESTDHPVDDALKRALVIARDCGGAPDEPREGGGAVGAWREAFLAMPYLRDALLRCGVMSDTFETAITWDRFDALHAEVMAAAHDALGPQARVTCRFTHVYPDGPAPYFTFLAPLRHGDEEAQWHEAKAAVSDALIAAGGTITHHHAVGRDHRPWYDVQRPAPFAAALRGAKAAVDPDGLLNPGVLI